MGDDTDATALVANVDVDISDCSKYSNDIILQLLTRDGSKLWHAHHYNVQGGSR